MYLPRDIVLYAPFLLGIVAIGCSKEPMNVNKEKSVPEFSMYDGTRYRCFSVGDGNAHAAELVAPENQGFQALLVMQIEHVLYPVEVEYRALAYGAFGMKESKAHQLGFFATRANSGWKPFVPHPLANEEVFMVFRTIDDVIENGVMRSEYGDWMVMQIHTDATVLDLSSIDGFQRLESNTELADQLEKMSFWTEFNSRYRNRPTTP